MVSELAYLGNTASMADPNFAIPCYYYQTCPPAIMPPPYAFHPFQPPDYSPPIPPYLYHQPQPPPHTPPTSYTPYTPQPPSYYTPPTSYTSPYLSDSSGIPWYSTNQHEIQARPNPYHPPSNCFTSPFITTTQFPFGVIDEQQPELVVSQVFDESPHSPELIFNSSNDNCHQMYDKFTEIIQKLEEIGKNLADQSRISKEMFSKKVSQSSHTLTHVPIVSNLDKSAVKFDFEEIDKLEARVVCEGVPNSILPMKDELGVEIEDSSTYETSGDMCEANDETETEGEVILEITEKVDAESEIETEMKLISEFGKGLEVALEDTVNMEMVASEQYVWESQVGGTKTMIFPANPNRKALTADDVYQLNSGTLLTIMKFDSSHDWGGVVSICVEGETELIKRVECETEPVRKDGEDAYQTYQGVIENAMKFGEKSVLIFDPGGHENQGVYVCHKCGWLFPKLYPSAKHRRAHKKICGNIEEYKLNGGPEDHRTFKRGLPPMDFGNAIRSLEYHNEGISKEENDSTFHLIKPGGAGNPSADVEDVNRDMITLEGKDVSLKDLGVYSCIAAEPNHGEKWQLKSKEVETYYQATEVILKRAVVALGDGGLRRWRNGILSAAAEAPGPGSDTPESTLVLAEKRTNRPDILSSFRHYRGGWDIANKHYWASVGYTGAAGFILAVIWFAFFGVALVVHYSCGFIKLTSKDTQWSRRICLIMLIVFTVAATIGCILLLVGQDEFHGEALNTLNYVVSQSDYTGQILRNVTGFLSLAKTVNVAQIVLPSDVKDDIDKLNTDLYTAAETLREKTNENSHKIKRVFDAVRLVLITVAAVMLIVSLLGLALSLLGYRHAIHIFVVSGWLLVAVTFILCGIFVILDNAISDTCMAMGDWVDHPHAETALSNILPCVDQRTTNKTLIQSKQVVNDLGDIVNGFIDTFANSDPPRQDNPNYFNQSGPPVPHLCYPYDSNQLEERQCAPQEVSMANASLVWQNYICSVSGSGLCSSVGRLTPDMYGQLVGAVNISYGLEHYAPLILSLQNCDFVRATFRHITTDYCSPLEYHLQIVNAGLAMISTGVLLSLVLWILYGNRPQREEVLARFSFGKLGRCGDKSCKDVNKDDVASRTSNVRSQA